MARIQQSRTCRSRAPRELIIENAGEIIFSTREHIIPCSYFQPFDEREYREWKLSFNNWPACKLGPLRDYFDDDRNLFRSDCSLNSPPAILFDRSLIESRVPILGIGIPTCYENSFVWNNNNTRDIMIIVRDNEQISTMSQEINTRGRALIPLW